MLIFHYGHKTIFFQSPSALFDFGHTKNVQNRFPFLLFGTKKSTFRGGSLSYKIIYIKIQKIYYSSSSVKSITCVCFILLGWLVSFNGKPFSHPGHL